MTLDDIVPFIENPKLKKAIETDLQLSRKGRTFWTQTLPQKFPALALQVRELRTTHQVSPLSALYRLTVGALTCKQCAQTFFHKGNGRNLFCSRRCSNRNESTKKNIERSLLEKYGVSNAMQAPQVRARFCKTMKRRHGVEYTAQSKGLRNKMKATILSRYGSYAVASSKARETWKKKYGKQGPLRDAMLRKRRATCLKRFGYINNSQDPRNVEKLQDTRYGRKEIVLGGQVFSYQGYEHHCLRDLVTRGIDPASIKTKVSEGKHSFRYQEEGQNRVYVPDIEFTRKGRTYIVEVKSLYTCGWVSSMNSRTLWRRTVQKAKAVELAGYPYLFALASSRGNIIYAYGVEAMISLRAKYAEYLRKSNP